MPRIAKMSKSEIAQALTVVFESRGYDGASLALLSKASGLSKASLYHHFGRGKEDMAAYVLGLAGIKLQKHILGPLNSEKTGRERILASFEGAGLYYSGDTPVCLMNSLMLGEGQHLFGAQVAKAVSVWKEGLSSAYAETSGNEKAGVWAASVIERIQGALIMCRIAQSRAPLESCLTEISSAIPN